ncbi:Glutathione synthetase [Lecanora helva]
MAAPIYPTYPPNLSPAQLDYLLANVKDWSILHGLAVRPAQAFVAEEIDPSRSLAVTAPVTLFPSLFPKACFEEAREIQTAYNELYALIAGDEKWLQEIVEDLMEVDDFIANLWNIHLSVKKEGYAQVPFPLITPLHRVDTDHGLKSLSLGIFRSDYMVHNNPSDVVTNAQIRQVEFNTIASSFGGLAAKVSDLHKHLLKISAYPTTASNVLTNDSLPSNPSIVSISKGLATAHVAYGPSRHSPPLPLCVLFIVQDPENNAFDQHALATPLLDHHHVLSFRLPFADVLSFTSTPKNHSSRPLVYAPPQSPETAYEVTMVYFRAGYSPNEYSTSFAWDARLHLERSAAIKCPSILTHLAGSKKVQQVLATPSSPHLSRFLSSNPQSARYIQRIQATFAAIYPLDNTDAGKYAISIAKDACKSKGYVLKPQREGGGNNVYGVKIPQFLEKLGNDEKKYRGHILMELIEPPALQNTVFRNGQVTTGEVIGELGIYGVCLWSNSNANEQPKIMENWEAGFLLRTKGRESEEGGVAAGFGAVDSVCLVDA